MHKIRVNVMWDHKKLQPVILEGVGETLDAAKIHVAKQYQPLIKATAKQDALVCKDTAKWQRARVRAIDADPLAFANEQLSEDFWKIVE